MCLRRRNAPSSPRSLQRSASAKSIRFSLAENCRRVAISITLGSGLRSSDECAMVEDRRTFALTESIADAERLFIEDFDTWDMTGYYLYAKYCRAGVSAHIGTWGRRHRVIERLDLQSLVGEFRIRQLALPGTRAITPPLI